MRMPLTFVRSVAALFPLFGLTTTSAAWHQKGRNLAPYNVTKSLWFVAVALSSHPAKLRKTHFYPRREMGFFKPTISFSLPRTVLFFLAPCVCQIRHFRSNDTEDQALLSVDGPICQRIGQTVLVLLNRFPSSVLGRLLKAILRRLPNPALRLQRGALGAFHSSIYSWKEEKITSFGSQEDAITLQSGLCLSSSSLSSLFCGLPFTIMIISPFSR